MMVHILLRGQPLCGFTSDASDKWPADQKAVPPDEAHLATCQGCISSLHNHDELEAAGQLTLGLQEVQG